MGRSRLDDLDDGALVRLAMDQRDSARGREAAAALFERYQQRVYHWCRRYVRDHDQALDLAQDVLTSAWRALDRFDGRAPFGGWLFVIARNRCFRAMRRPSLIRDEDAELDEVADPQRGPDEIVEERDREETVLGLIREHLEPLEQDVLWLRCEEGMSVEEINRILRLTTASGARGLLQSARRKLRAELGRKGVEP